MKNLNYDKDKLMEQVKNVASFKTNKDFFRVLLDHIENDKLDKHIPLDFSSSIDLNNGVLYKDGIGIFFDGTWEGKVSSICAFAKSLEFTIDESILKIITPKSFFNNILFGIEFAGKQYPERMKIYLILGQNYKDKFKNEEIMNFLFNHLGFSKRNIINPDDRLNSFSLDLYKNGEVILKVYVDSLENSFSIFDQFSRETENRTIKSILNIIQEKIIIEANDVIIGCYRITKEGHLNELKRINVPLRGKGETVRGILKKTDFKGKLTLFDNVVFSFVTIDLKNKMTFYYGPNHYINYINYA